MAFPANPDLALLIGDDDVAQRQTMVDLVSGHGCRVYTAGSGREALTILKEAPIDAIILDIHMPGFTGVEVLEMYQRGVWRDGPRFIAPGRVPAIFLSADVSPDLEHRCQATGNPLLSKPVNLSTIRAEIDRLLQRLDH